MLFLTSPKFFQEFYLTEALSDTSTLTLARSTKVSKRVGVVTTTGLTFRVVKITLDTSVTAKPLVTFTALTLTSDHVALLGLRAIITAVTWLKTIEG